MKRLCLLLVLLLLLTGCGKATAPPAVPSAPSTTVTDSTATTHTTITASTSTSTTTAALADTTTAPQPLVLDIFAVNDLHGKLVDTAAQPGVDEMTTYLKQAQQAGHTLLLSTGDMWQGASESNLTGGRMVTEWMNELGFAAMTVGGHEFDWGEEQIRQNEALATFPFLGINIFSRATRQRVDYCRSSVVVEMDGVQIGIIGAIGDPTYSIAAENIKDLYFPSGAELTALITAECDKLRSEGVDFIIYAVHDGYAATSVDGTISDEALAAYYDVTLSDGYVDLVFEADTHYAYTLVDRHGVYHLQGGGNNTAISHARVQIDATKDEVSVQIARQVRAAQYSEAEDDPVVEELLDKYAQQIAPSDRLLGTNARYRGKAAICQLVADLYCAKGVEKWGSEYDIVLGGGYISCRSPGYLSAGEVRYGQLLSLLPFDNQITLCSIRGRDLIRRFLETENEAYYLRTTEYYETIRNDIDPDGIYYVVTDTYSAHYSYNNMTVVDTYAADVYARDLMADYIAAGGLQ